MMELFSKFCLQILCHTHRHGVGPYAATGPTPSVGQLQNIVLVLQHDHCALFNATQALLKALQELVHLESVASLEIVHRTDRMV